MFLLVSDLLSHTVDYCSRLWSETDVLMGEETENL